MFNKIFYFIIFFIFIFFACKNKNSISDKQNISYHQDSIYAILKDVYSAEYLITQIRYIPPYDSISDADLTRYIYSAVMKKHNINDSQIVEILKNLTYNNRKDILDSLYNELYFLSFQ
jgi:hypothetical protein